MNRQKIWLGGLGVGLLLGILASTAIAPAIAGSGLSKLTGRFFAGDVLLKRSGDMKLEIHADSDSVTADAILLDIKTGNAAPDSKFSVDEDGDVSADGTITASAFDAGLTNGSVVFNGSGVLNQDNSNLFWDDGNNRLGIGTASPDSDLEVSRLTGNGGQYLIIANEERPGSSGAAHQKAFAISGNQEEIVAIGALSNFTAGDAALTHFYINVNETNIAAGTGYTNAEFVILADGNVGIGDTAPSSKLEVNGTITATALVGAWDPGLTQGSLLFDGGTSVSEDSANLFWDNTAKELGVGTNAPSTYLHVAADGVGDYDSVDVQIGGTEGNLRIGAVNSDSGFQIFTDATTYPHQLVLQTELNPDAADYEMFSVRSSGAAERFSVIHGTAGYASQFYDSLAIGVSGDNSPTTSAVDLGTGAGGDLYVMDDAEIDGVLYADGGLSISGTSLTATATELNTVTGGGNADSLHSHSGAGGGGDGSDLQQVWYDTEFTSTDLTFNDVEVADGSLQLLASDPGTYVNFGISGNAQRTITNGSYITQTFTVANLDTDSVKSVYFYTYFSGNKYVELYNGANTTLLGTSNTQTGTGYRTYTFSTHVNVGAETTITFRVHNNSGADGNILMSTGNAYAGGAASTGANDDWYNGRVYSGKPYSGTAYIRPGQPTTEAMDSWEKVSFGTSGTGTKTIDLIRTDTDATISGYAGVASDVDISGIATSLNVGFKLTLTRTALGNNPTFDWCARSFTSEYFWEGAQDTSGTTGQSSPWTVHAVINAAPTTGAIVYGNVLPSGSEYLVLLMYATSDQGDLSTSNADRVNFMFYERPPKAFGSNDTSGTVYNSTRGDTSFDIIESIPSWNLASGSYSGTTVSNNFAILRDVHPDPYGTQTSTALSELLNADGVSAGWCDVDYQADGSLRVDPSTNSYDWAAIIFSRNKK